MTLAVVSVPVTASVPALVKLVRTEFEVMFQELVASIVMAVRLAEPVRVVPFCRLAVIVLVLSA